MVNYSRMETVWRSYGPLEPIGSSRPRPRRRPAKAMAAGLAATCVVGAAAGLYLRPNLETGPAPEAPAVDESSLTRVSTAPSEPVGPPQEAARLQSQLQMLVLGGVAPTASATDVPETAAASAPVGAPTPAQAPPQTPSVERSAPRPASKPMTLASRSPGAVVLPRAPRRTAPARAPATPTDASEAPAPEPVRMAAAASAPSPTELEPVRRAEGPAYDCGRARSSAERMVCASPELATLDRNMAAELEAAVAAGHSPRELARDQASWRRRRDRAAPDPRAVADQYRQRIGQLRSMQ